MAVTAVRDAPLGDEPEEIVAASEPEVVGGDPREDEDDEVWMWRTPERKLRLPYAVGMDPVDPKDLRKGYGYYTRDVELTRMDGAAEALLSDDSGDRAAVQARRMEMFSRCITRIGKKARTEPSRVKDPGLFVDDLNRFPLANEAFLTIRLRQVAAHSPAEYISGHKFEFKATCPACRKLSPGMSTRLDTLLVKEASDAFCEEPTHTLSLSEHEVVWRNLRMGDKPRLMRGMDELPGDKLAIMFYLAAVTVDGERPKRPQDFAAWDSADRRAFARALEAGGMDMDIRVKCPSPVCGREYEMPLPVGQESFFSPAAGSSPPPTTPRG